MQHSTAQRRRQLGAARARQSPDAPTPPPLAGPAPDDQRMASLSASIDPFWGAPGLHAAQCADAACHKGNHAMCGGHIAAHCADLCPQICRHYDKDKRCAYGARAPDRVPGEPPARDDLKEKQLLHAHCVPNTTRYVDFEQNPASALLLLAHNTNLGSFPALQRLSDPGVRARPLEFDSVINEWKVEINTLVRDIVAARPEQLYDALDYRQAQCTPARHAPACALK